MNYAVFATYNKNFITNRNRKCMGNILPKLTQPFFSSFADEILSSWQQQPLNKIVSTNKKTRNKNKFGQHNLYFRSIYTFL
jgi:hypothetical protein